MNIVQIKKKIRNLKKYESRMRFVGREVKPDRFIWSKYFSTSSDDVKYPIIDLLRLSDEELKEVYEEYLYAMYFQYYKENGISLDNFFDPNLLDLFGLPVTATKEEIKDKFRKLSKRLHPDKGGNPEDFIKMKKIYDDLMN